MDKNETSANGKILARRRIKGRHKLTVSSRPRHKNNDCNQYRGRYYFGNGFSIPCLHITL
jgi:hypothetical protein